MESATAAPTDADLLTAWLRRGREESFHELVARYAGLVRMAAWRTCGDDTLAAEAAHLVFILLVRKAKSLTHRQSLAGWLHLAAVLQAKNLMRQQRREFRKRQQLQAAMEPEPENLTGDAWREMRPVLDDALASLATKDREALLLRFYRTLSVREIAGVLRIGTDAAQKRLDRATVRLRGQLVRRGCQAGGVSIASVLCAGFAADSQAALPGAAILSCNALSAGAAGASASTSTAHVLLKLTTTLKTSSLIPPVAALLLAAGWLVPKYRALAAAEKENGLLSQRIAAARRPLPAGTDSTAPNPDGRSIVGSLKAVETMDWKSLAAVLADQGSSTQLSLRQAQAMLEAKARIPKMSKDELSRALDEVITYSKKLDDMGCGQLMGGLGSWLLEPLVRMNPQFALTQYLPYLKEGGRFYAFTRPLGDVFGNWVKSDVTAAAAWLDSRTAAGDFEGKSLKDDFSRNVFEWSLMEELFVSNRPEAERRLSSLPVPQRKVMLANLTGSAGKADPVAFAALLRSNLPVQDQPKAIARLANAMRGNKPFSELESILASIGGTPEDRMVSVESEAGSLVDHQVYPDQGRKGIWKVGDLGEVRQWLREEAPAEADRITGVTLADLLKSPGQMSFGEIAALAGKYDNESGGSEVLASFLECAAGTAHKEEARAMAASIAEESLRARVLKKLE